MLPLFKLKGLALLFFSFLVVSQSFGQIDRYQCQARVPAGVFTPFRLEVEKVFGKPNPNLWLQNREERIPLEYRRSIGDTLFYALGQFDAELAVFLYPPLLAGYYYRYDTRQGTLRVPIRGFIGKPATPLAMPETKFDVVFDDGEGGTYASVGHFKGLSPAGKHAIAATFETSTGDYRFLEGEQENDSLWVSTFDGAHLYLFTARIKGDSLLKGKFFSVGKGYETWRGVKNPSAKLPNDLELHGVNKGIPITVAAFDTNGIKHTLDDPAYKNKPVIIPISGTWCPNCLDEAQFLSKWYHTPARKDVQVLSLSFERKSDPTYWKARIKRSIQVQKIPYTVGYAGVSNTDSSSKALPWLKDGVKAYPTMIFLNRAHEVVAVHAGFAGPATGLPFAEFKSQFNELILNILK
jgi:thiol-disulfide isomerase/thioredoxin